MDLSEKIMRRGKLSVAFSPAAPVSRLNRFSGRTEQLGRVGDAVLQRGQHAVVYGERGVGKTSLANVLSDWLQALSRYDYQIVRHNCSAVSSFASIWEGVFRELSFKRDRDGLMEIPAPIPVASYLPADPGSEDVRFLLQQTGSPTVVIIDEYDRVPRKSGISALLADTIKSLSDHAVESTLIIIGVADSIDDLIAEHRSVERCLVQIQLPRMSEVELFSILDTGFSHAEMKIEDRAKWQVAAFSQGLPHNTHKLGLLAGYACLDAGRVEATKMDLDTAVEQAVENTEQSIVSSYCQAVASPHKSIYKEILLAAAMARTDDIGYFAAGDLREPLQAILEKKYGIDAYMRHLNSFCDSSRGKILQRKGERRRYRFRFSESIMGPYVIMRGLADKLVDTQTVLRFQLSGYAFSTPSLF